MKLNPKEIQIVQNFLDKALHLEKAWDLEEQKEVKISELKKDLENFKSGSEILKKQSEISKHLNSNLTAQQFSNFLIPLERLIDRNLKDDDFLITTQDTLKTKGSHLPLVVICDNLRSSFNVGAIFRTAECLNLEKIYLCGYTPTPEDLKTQKTSMGTSELVTWDSWKSSTQELILKLKAQNYYVTALETAQKSKNYSVPWIQKPTAIILGNERFGLDHQILNLCDEVRSIPTFGIKNSLNVGISFSIASFEFRRQFDGN